MADDAAAEKRVGEILFGAVNELVRKNNITRLVFGLEGADGADADDPGHAKFFHGPEIGAMIKLARQDAVSAAMTRQEHDVASGQFPGKKIVGR